MSDLINITFSDEFIEKWRFLLKGLYNYKFYDEFVVVPSMLRKKTYSYLPLLNYTDRTDEQVEDLLDKVKNLKYQIRALNFKYRDFKENDTVTMRIDLDKKDIEELFLFTVSKRNRRYIRQRSSDDIVIKKGNSSDLIADFYDIFSDVMHKHGTPVFSRRLFVNLAQTLAATYYVVYLKDVPLSAAVIIDDQKISWIPWSGTHSEFKDNRPGLVMYWETIKDAYCKKKLIYDFGRSNFGGGPYVYKTRWGATPVKIDILQPKSSNVYKKYGYAARIWRKFPSGVAGRIGPRICRYLSDL